MGERTLEERHVMLTALVKEHVARLAEVERRIAGVEEHARLAAVKLDEVIDATAERLAALEAKEKIGPNLSFAGPEGKPLSLEAAPTPVAQPSACDERCWGTDPLDRKLYPWAVRRDGWRCAFHHGIVATVPLTNPAHAKATDVVNQREEDRHERVAPNVAAHATPAEAGSGARSQAPAPTTSAPTAPGTATSSVAPAVAATGRLCPLCGSGHEPGAKCWTPTATVTTQDLADALGRYAGAHPSSAEADILAAWTAQGGDVALRATSEASRWWRKAAEQWQQRATDADAALAKEKAAHALERAEHERTWNRMAKAQDALAALRTACVLSEEEQEATAHMSAHPEYYIDKSKIIARVVDRITKAAGGAT